MTRGMKLLVLVVAGCTVALLAGCTGVVPSGLLGGGGSTSSQPSSSSAETGTPAPAPVPLERVAFARSLKPRSADPVLKHGDWGFHAPVDYNDSDDGDLYELHSAVVQDELLDLILEQRCKLLHIFKSSPEVHKLIKKHGGELDDVVYSVESIDAHADTAESTPWVTATLRATYPSVGGRRVVDVFVYRQKTAEGLDNTPYVSGTSVGYVQSDGTISNPSSPAFPR